jgi:hypothetical protein
MQQIMEILLVRMDINTKANQEDLPARMEAKIYAHTETDGKHVQQMMARMDTNQERMIASLREEIQSGQVEMRPIVDDWIADTMDD